MYVKLYNISKFITNFLADFMSAGSINYVCKLTNLTRLILDDTLDNDYLWQLTSLQKLQYLKLGTKQKEERMPLLIQLVQYFPKLQVLAVDDEKLLEKYAPQFPKHLLVVSEPLGYL
jgi:hypothetical protein